MGIGGRDRKAIRRSIKKLWNGKILPKVWILHKGGVEDMKREKGQGGRKGLLLKDMFRNREIRFSY